MESKSLHEIRAIARVHPDVPQPEAMSKQQRLERWAAVLEQRGGQKLRPLVRVEYLSSGERQHLRIDNSPLSVAFQDDDLRAAGLESDRLGDAIKFFGLSDQQAHLLVCDCYYGGAMRATQVARRIRSVVLTENVPKTLALWGLWAVCALPFAALVLSGH